MSYARLNQQEIVATIARLHRRISERFPDANLARVIELPVRATHITTATTAFDLAEGLTLHPNTVAINPRPG